ncbi:beta-galactosidase GalB [Chitinophaga flava]|uniref:Beta-galactosidase n=1 Tax=Chitinophaga flava TaxID=2259036 RepID=A0A365XWW9_9BACT|nr:beta-galactosidase GalB [Chitinophaga flava]RBL90843.1 beta-galactosidase [Chitinophaga flava]
MNRITALLVLLLTWMPSGDVFSQSQMHREGNADVQSFDSEWRFRRFGLQADGSQMPEPAGLEQSGLDDHQWTQLDLPHDWAIAGPFRIELSGNTGKLPWKGIGWYRKKFVVDTKDAGRRIFLDFDGAMAYAKIWVNGKYVGTWPYGYSSFRMDITPFLNFGKDNTVAVRLDTESWDSRWYPGAGLYRHVWLVKTQPVHTAHWGTYITTDNISERQADVCLKVNIQNQGRKHMTSQVTTELFESPDGKNMGRKVAYFKPQSVQISPDSTRELSAHLTLSAPRLWTLETPAVYIARTTVNTPGMKPDIYNTVFGIRKLEFTHGKGFLLNGKRTEIKGVCLHHDLGSLGAAINTAALRRQLTIMKNMGCNAIRTSHNPPAPELLELADQMGLLVWDESFDAWKRGKRKNDYNKLFPEWHEKDLVAMVHRDRNHPAVIIWSIGNEVMDQQDVAITRELTDIVHREDPTRPVSNAYNDPDGGRASGAAACLDLMGVNYFFSKQPQWDNDERFKNKPTMGSETSSCVSSRGTYFFGTNYENYQVTSYDVAWPGWGCSPDEQFRINARYPHLLGEFVWTGFDYLGEPTPFNSDETNLLNFRTDSTKRKELEKALEEIRKKNPPSRSSYFGIVDLCGFPKDRFYSYQAHWRPDYPMAHIMPHWTWPGRKDSITPVHVYTSGDMAELFLNGESKGKKYKRPGEDFRLVWDSVVYQPGELRVVAYKNGKVWATDTMRTVGPRQKLLLLPETNTVKADGVDLCYIKLLVCDENNRMVPDASDNLNFSIEGPGEIVATDNGDATCLISFSSLVRPAYNGMAQVIIKAKKGAGGKIKVLAQTDTGLKKAETIINIK